MQVESFRAFYDAHRAYVWHRLRRLGVPDRDLEDVAHEVFMVAHRLFATLDPSRPARPWLFAVMFRCASEHRRRNARQVPSETAHTEPAVAPVAETLLLGDERRRMVQIAIDSIDLEPRSVFILHDLDGISAPEIAATLEIPLNTAYSRLRRARADFASALARLTRTGGAP